jgi:hypothetical protein
MDIYKYNCIDAQEHFLLDATHYNSRQETETDPTRALIDYATQASTANSNTASKGIRTNP